MTSGTSLDTLRGERAVWRIEQPLPAEIRECIQGLSPMLCHVLYCRGFRTLEAIEGFFRQGTTSHDPFLLPDMRAAVDRIIRAVNDGERVAVYGDFDCDGITATTVLMETLNALGLEPIPYVPEREDGHGLHPEALAALADQDVTCVLSADCGITSIEEVQVARGMGMDLIVTDHHEPRPDGSLPDCLVVSPTRLDSEYPFRALCGVGVAYKLVQALAQSYPSRLDPDNLLDLVALGTIADVVPLIDENRSLVVQGLKRLQQTWRPGLRALFETAGVDPRRIDPVSVGYYLAPRINAANRMSTPRIAYDLISATDPDRAAEIAGQLSGYNQQRQLLVAEKLAEIAEQIGPPSFIMEEVSAGRRAPLLVVVGRWPAGISGLLASKLVDLYGLPAFVGTDGGAGIVSVSARSIPGVPIDEMLEGCQASLPGGIFIGYGGHAGAGGFRVDSDRFPIAQSMLEQEVVRHVHVDDIGATLTVDAEVSLSSLTVHAAQQVRSLAPFGTGFPEPLFLARDVTLKRRSSVGDGKHARIAVRRGTGFVDGICFNASAALLSLPLESRLDIVFHLQLHEYGGTTRPEISVRDWRPAPA